MLKSTLFLAFLVTLSSNAFAWPGTNRVTCKSLPGAQNKISLVVSMTGTPTPDMPAEVDISIDSTSVKLDEPVRTAIQIIAVPSDGVITAGYEERDENHEIYLKVWSKPGSIQGDLNKETCVAKYTFHAGFAGGIDYWGGNTDKNVDAADDLECEYHETFGSAGC